MAGMLYGVGVGPGDPELMTLKACRIIAESDIVAVPGKTAEESAAFKIAVQAVPQMRTKETVSLWFPMTQNPQTLEKSHREASKRLEEYLKRGKDVAFLTLGDATLYSTFTYVERIVKKDGYRTQTVSGVPSFCAAAAALGESLAEGTQPVHILPSVKEEGEQPAAYILMKSGNRLGKIKKALIENGYQAQMVENCGMPEQKLYRRPEDFPDEAGYFSLVIAKRQKAGR